MGNLEIPKKGLPALKAYFKNDLLAGFSVSLIALPLCLGIAIASGVPPLAGLITAIIGGIVASRFSGSFVTISGPAAGLIVITLGAAEAMGGAGAEDAFAGYPHALGAIVIGGLIMALFGLLKVGKVGDYFPSAAVHGMLAAIGIIIIIKQFFPAIGAPSPKGEILEVAEEIPAAFGKLNMNAVIIAGTSLLILIVHPFLKTKWIKMIPAPMWVLIFAIPIAAIIGVQNLDMVTMPHNILGEGGIQYPSFAKIGESAFWIAVAGFALVSAIESLLSAKAVDSLDPYKRSSNLDKDLVAMGAGSSLAAAIGGLPMISEIVRSSANVNNGAKTQWANFYHGVFLLIYLLIGVVVIEMIPIAALSAMLVYTGFKLASPKEFKHMFQIGLMELEIFLITLVAVLATDLIIGIAIGIIFKYILILFKGAKVNELFRSKLEIENKSNKKIIHLSGFQIFSNYLSLKKKLDSGVEKYDELILDFTNVKFVDHTVMEHLEDYARLAKMNGKHVHIENVESLNPVSDHPLAARDLNAKNKINKLDVDNRAVTLLDYAIKHGYQFIHEVNNENDWDFYSVTTRKKINSIKNVLTKKSGVASLILADIETEVGAETSKDVNEITVLKISGLPSLPPFYMGEENFFDKIKDKLFQTDINFKNHPEFSKRNILKGLNEQEVREVFTSKLITYFEEHPGLYLISNGKELLIRTKYSLLSTEEMTQLEMYANELITLISTK